MTNTIDASSLLPALKHSYVAGNQVQNLAYNGKPLLAIMKKKTDFVGDLMVWPIRVSRAQLTSATTAQALTNSTLAQPVIKQFQYDVVDHHAWATFDHKTQLRSRNDKGAYFQAAKIVADDALEDISMQVANSLYRGGYGEIGTIKAIPGAAATITLVNVDDVVNFYPGTQCQFSASLSGNSLRGSAGSLTVLSVDRDAGSVVFTANVSTVSGVVAGDVIFKKSFRQDSATPARLGMSGLAAWLPTVAPVNGDSFFGVDRSVDSLLSGVRVAGSATSIEDSFKDLSIALGKRNAKLDVIVCSFNTYGSLISNMNAQVFRQEPKKVGMLSFESIKLNTPKGVVDVLPDYACPDGIAYGLNLDTWSVVSMGELFQLFDGDGIDGLRGSSDNSIQLRWFSMAQLMCSAPGLNGVVTLT